MQLEKGEGAGQGDFSRLSKKFDTTGEHTSGMLASLGRISDPAFSSLGEITDSPPVKYAQ
ncbi:MAG: hypothetical protein Q8R47_04750 [Nanoarchaeota archaeon]|nr:hypothetical protein [Nanoarchaeota archaeon]